MQPSRSRRFGALVVGLALVAAACGSDEQPSAGTEPPTQGVCAGESDDQLRIGTVLPQTGNLEFLGPPIYAAAELAVRDINAAGGVIGQDVLLTQGDSGDSSTDIATQTVDSHLAAGVDAFIAAASSAASFSFIDTLVENCKIHFSPTNTSPEFTNYDDGGLYFRTAPSDVLQGRVIADLMIDEGVADAVFMALQDPYGESLLEYSSEPFAGQGGTVVDSFTYDPMLATFDAEVDRVVSADPSALVLIGFAETAQILADLFASGFTPDIKKIYLVGIGGNALTEGFAPGEFLGIRATLPAAEITDSFKDALLAVDSSLIDYSFAPETYDAVVITALAAAVAGTDDPGAVAAAMIGVTRDGETCTTFADCIALVEAGTDIDYDGPSGPQTFGPEGEPTEASFQILTYDDTNQVYGTIAPEYRFARI